MRSRDLIALVALCALLLVGMRPALAAQGDATPAPATPQPRLPVTVTDVSGARVTVQDISRIVPLNPDVTEIIWALGLGDRVVAVDTSASYPPEVQQLPKIGYQRQLSAEGILSLNPTLIIGTEAAGPPEVIAQLRDSGTPVVIISDPVDLQAPIVKTRAVAEALGVAEAGEQLAERIASEIASAQAAAAEAASRPRVVFLYVRGTATQMIGGAGTSADAMIVAAGGINAAAEAGIVGYKPLTAEALAAASPDVLLLLSAGLESVGGIDGLLQIPGVAQTSAGQQQRVLAYDDLYLLGMGPRTGQALRDLVHGLHPELAPASPVASPAAGA